MRLVSWIGGNDLGAAEAKAGHPGAVAATLASAPFTELHLLYSYSEKRVANYLFWLSPNYNLPIAKRIANILDKADTLHRKRQQTIKFTDDFLRSILLEMFDDSVTNPKGFELKWLSEFYIDPKNGTKCGPFGSALKKEEFQDQGVPDWNMDNISLDGHFMDSPSIWVSEAKFSEIETYSVNQGNVIISRAGTVGKMGIVRSKYSKSLISTNLIRVRFGELLLPEHFVSLMIFL